MIGYKLRPRWVSTRCAMGKNELIPLQRWARSLARSMKVLMRVDTPEGTLEQQWLIPEDTPADLATRRKWAYSVSGVPEPPGCVYCGAAAPQTLDGVRLCAVCQSVRNAERRDNASQS